VTRRLPDSHAILLQRVEMLLAYGNVCLLLGGLRDPRAQRAYDEAHAEARPLDDDVLRFRTLLGRCVSALFRGAPEADAIAADLVQIATSGHPELAAAAHLYDGYVKHTRGDLAASAESARRAHAMLPHAVLGIPRETCLEAHVLVHLSRTALLAGDLTEATRLSAQTAAVARERATPADCVAILGHLASIAMLAGDAATSLALADEAIALGERHGIDQHPVPGLAVTCSAWARCALGRGAAADLADAIDRRERSGEVWYQPVLLGVLAELQIAAGDVDAARATLDRAASVDEALWRAELRRVDGELALATGDRAAARRRFEEAAHIAGEQGALLFVERARSALARVRGSS
jgi:tetratricopeptide (TPR) repeat protein